MRTARQGGLRQWGLVAIAVLLSAGAAYTYFLAAAHGVAAVDWIGLRGRAGDVVAARRWATYWLVVSVCCWGASSVAGALATSIYEEAPLVPRFIGRLILASMICFVLTVLIGWVSVSIIVAFHRSIVR
jgi:hypothetical protein